MTEPKSVNDETIIDDNYGINPNSCINSAELAYNLTHPNDSTKWFNDVVDHIDELIAKARAEGVAEGMERERNRWMDKVIYRAAPGHETCQLGHCRYRKVAGVILVEHGPSCPAYIAPPISRSVLMPRSGYQGAGVVPEGPIRTAPPDNQETTDA